MRSHPETGSGRMGFILTLMVVAAVIFAGVKIVPVRINAYQFRDAMREETRLGAVRRSDDEVVQRILAEAKDLQIPLVRKNLSVQRTKSRIIVAARYEQPIDLKVMTYVFKFTAREEAPLF